MSILSVNAGSSSLKFALYCLDEHGNMAAMLTGSFQGLEPGASPQLQYTLEGTLRQCLFPIEKGDGFVVALKQLQSLITSLPKLPAIRAVSHRIVHGGAKYRDSVMARPDILKDLAQLNSLAPLHQPHNLKGVEVFGQAFPQIPQVLCFDTAYHRTLPPMESAMALPPSITDQGVRRYGFHGLSYQFIMDSLAASTQRAHQRVLMAHLGNGASLCAAQNGVSLATTMGFSTLDGLMMGTRVGALDPGVILYLLEKGYTHDQLVHLLYSQSGLLGVSGQSADMRSLRLSGSVMAQNAISLFIHRVVRESGAMVACLKGLDVLAFSGGIGEHDPLLRQAVCQELSWLGIELDGSNNELARGERIRKISTDASPIEVWVIPTDEGRVCAQLAHQVLMKSTDPPSPNFKGKGAT